MSSEPHGWASGTRPSPKGRGEEAVERVRKGWGIVAAPALAGGGSGRRWNTNMRIKAVEGIKAYNRGADLSGLRLSERLSVCSIVLRVIRTCVRQRISAGHRVAGCGFASGCRQNFLNFRL